MSQWRMRRKVASVVTHRSYRVAVMIRCPAGLLLLALVALGGCAGGESLAPDPLVAIAGPDDFESFELRDGQRVLWRVVADEPTPLDEIVYGQVPAGFRQETPAGGAGPRALVTGELLVLESMTPSRVFHHEGLVVDGQRLAIDFWEMRLRQPSGPAGLDDPPAPS